MRQNIKKTLYGKHQDKTFKWRFMYLGQTIILTNNSTDLNEPFKQAIWRAVPLSNSLH